MKFYAIRRMIGLAVLIAISLCGCEGALVDSVRDNGAIVEEALDNFEVNANTPTSHPDAKNDPENMLDYPAVNIDREEQEEKKQETFYNGEATVVSVSGNHITMKYNGGAMGSNTTVTFEDPSHRYNLNEVFVIVVKSNSVKVTQINPMQQLGRFRIVNAPEDGR